MLNRLHFSPLTYFDTCHLHFHQTHSHLFLSVSYHMGHPEKQGSSHQWEAPTKCDTMTTRPFANNFRFIFQACYAIICKSPVKLSARSLPSLVPHAQSSFQVAVLTVGCPGWADERQYRQGHLHDCRNVPLSSFAPPGAGSSRKQN